MCVLEIEVLLLCYIPVEHTLVGKSLTAKTLSEVNINIIQVTPQL